VSSPHFRYFASSADRITPGILDRLERHRADVLGYLGFSDERVTDYYLFDSVDDFNFVDWCKDAEGCTNGNTIYTITPFDSHELMHAYLSPSETAYIIEEGTAEAFHCGEELRAWVFAPAAITRWPDIVAQSPWDGNGEVYRWGVRLVLHLIRQYGAPRFLDYYRGTHRTDDPALFALEFEQFWGQPFDQTWALLTEGINAPEQPLCPCHGQAVPTDGTLMAIGGIADYAVLPSLRSGQSLALVVNGVGAKVGKCDVTAMTPLGQQDSSGSQAPSPALVVLDIGTQGYFVSVASPTVVSATIASLAEPKCEDAATLEVPPGISELSIVLSHRNHDLLQYVRSSFPTPFGANVTHSDFDRLGTYADCGLGTYTPLFLGSEYSALNPVLELSENPIPIDKGTLSVVSFAVAQQ
jgi:hypothetical protein